MKKWSAWHRFPDPVRLEYLHAPIGPGVYELRLKSTGEPLLIGEGGHLAQRMSSILPTPFGTGTRRNSAKREFVKAHLGDVEYRTVACATKQEARDIEGGRKSKISYRFPT
jgi:hypothetical protein